MQSRLLALLLGGCIGVSSAAAEPIIDFEAEWDTEGAIGAPFTMHGRLLEATGLLTAQPVVGATVELTLTKGEERRRVVTQTDVQGDAWLSLDTTGMSPGGWHKSIEYALPPTADGPAGGGGMGSARAIEFAPAIITHLTTDRPVYEPDQTVRWRLTSVHRVTGRPERGAADVVIKDPRGTQVWRGALKLDDRGMVAGTLPLGRDARRGSWTITATVGGAVTRHQFGFKRVTLAPFAITTERLGRSPGGDLRVRVRATYPYGEPVKGAMTVNVAPLKGAPQPLVNGEAVLTLRPHPNRATRAEITVRDGAEREARAVVEMPTRRVARGQIAILAEPLVAGQPAAVTVLTTDAQGAFAAGEIEVRVGDARARRLQTPGAIVVPVRPKGARLLVDVGFGDARHRADLEVAAKTAPRVRAVRSIVQPGEPIELRGRWPVAYGMLHATVFHSDAPIAQVRVRRDRSGRVRARIPALDVRGLVQVRVTDTGWVPAPDANLDLPSAAVDVYVQPPRLTVELTPDARRLRPGDVAHLAVQVRDAAGMAVAGAGLAASVVDTRLLALGALPPALMQSIADLDVGDAAAAGLAFSALLDRAEPAARVARAALLDSLPDDTPTPERVVPAADRWQAEHARLKHLPDAMIANAADWYGRLARYDAKRGWRFVAPLAELLPQPERRDPWARLVTWDYVAQLQLDYRFETHAEAIFYARVDLLREAVFADDELMLTANDGGALTGISAHLLRDPWGTPVRFPRGEGGVDLLSAGPDRRIGSKDDLRVTNIFSLRGYGAGGSGLGARRYGRVARVMAGRPMVAGRHRRMSVTGPAVRKNFEGTVLWSIGQRTDAQGQAQFDVPLSDRITGWQVDVEAVGKDGALGHARTQLETFLPRFADVQLPPALAVGDAYTAHAYVTNHGPESTLDLSVTAQDGLEVTAPVAARLTLAKGESRRIAVPLRAHAAGQGRVNLTLSVDGSAIDKVERRLLIEPPGALIERVVSRRLGEDTQMTVDVPADVTAPTATLRVFRSPSDMALDGLDAMLRTPHGCFEQTSSTTFPNLLVLDLLQSSPGLAKVRRRAEKLVALGYQRLISYEVDGGGFSWFGEAPANQVLTAYGVLEFADMAKVYPVDPALIARTSEWLLKRQQADGSWAPDKTWLHDWKAVQEGAQATTAWIVWTLAEAGVTDPRLQQGVAFLERHLDDLDAFELGLLAGAQTRLKRTPTAVAKLLRHEKAGRITAGRSLFSRSAKSADTQTTALANTAFLRTGDTRRADAGLDWIWQQRTARGWGNTQATVLALRAALGHRTAPPPPGTRLPITLNGAALQPLDLDGDDVPTRALAISAGQSTIEFGETSDVRADLRLSWRSVEPPTEPSDAGLQVRVTRPSSVVPVGHAAQFSVAVRNPGDAAVPMPTIEVPIPPGFRVDEAHFPPAGVARAEDQGDRVVFYLKSLAAGGRRSITWTLQALAEVDVLHRPATVFAYYDEDIRGSSAAGRIVTRAKTAVAQDDAPRPALKWISSARAR